MPLLALIGVSIGVGVASAISSAEPVMQAFMHGTMGFSLCVFALLKLFDRDGFANGFEMYDLFARHSRSYARRYPYLELLLGLSYFALDSGPLLYLLYVATIAVFAVGAVGVSLALRDGLDIQCPCMGNVLEVPLSSVSLVEDLGMLAMASMLLIAM